MVKVAHAERLTLRVRTHVSLEAERVDNWNVGFDGV